MRVLIVDDEPAYRRELRDILEGEGHSVACLPGLSSRDLDQLCLEHDLLVVDLMLRESLGGLALARYLSDRHPRKAMIMISGFPYSESLGPLRSGRRAFLAKPFGRFELLATIERIAPEERSPTHRP